MFEIKNGKGGYDKTVIIKNINLKIDKHEKVALLGRNGAGKTTLLKYIMRLLNLHQGQIIMNQQTLDNKITSRAKIGIAYVPQGRFVFQRLSVIENIKVVAFANHYDSKEAIENAFSYFPTLKDHSNRDAGSLSGGQQQILAISRALALKPKIILLDEPTEGIQPSIIDNINEVLNKLNKTKKMALLVAEQNLDFCISLCDKAFIMNQGTISKTNNIEDLSNDKKSLKALLAI